MILFVKLLLADNVMPLVQVGCDHIIFSCSHIHPEHVVINNNQMTWK
jgi:hypothetical protein